MHTRRVLLVTALLVAGCSSSAEFAISNTSSAPLRLVEINVVKSYGHGEFQTTPTSEHDQFIKVEHVAPAETRSTPYVSLSEAVIDIRVTRADGRVERFNSGYADDLFSGRHRIEVTEVAILFNGNIPNEVERDPEAHYGKFPPKR